MKDAMTFATASAASNAKNERNDCAVKAVAIVTNTDYDIAHETLRKNGRRNRRGTYKHCTYKSIKDLGCTYEDVTYQYPNAKTVTSAAKYLRSGQFLVFVRGHVAAVTDGKVQDWTEGRRHRVISIQRITKTNPTPEPAPKPVTAPTIIARGKNRFGCRIGTDAAKVTACLTATPKSMAQLVAESGGVTQYGLMKKLIEKGLVEKFGKKFALK